MTDLEREVAELRAELEDMKILVALIIAGDLEVRIDRIDLSELESEVKH